MTTMPPTAPALLLDAKQVADLLGCSPRHVRRLSDLGEFPKPLAVGTKLRRWPRSAVVAWVEARTIPGARR